MARTATSVIRGLERGALVAGLLAGLLAVLMLGLTPAAPAASAAHASADGATTYYLDDAQPTGALVLAQAASLLEMTLTATDGTGATVWSVSGGDVTAESGTLPAALVAVFEDPDPNKPSSGTLTAYDASGSVRFRKQFANEFVQPLCDTPTRLVWAERSAQSVTRVFVRQGSMTRWLTLPYHPPKAYFINPAASSADGSRLVVGAYLARPSKWRTRMYWLRVSPRGVPRVVAQKTTDWVSVALSPNGRKAAVITSGDPPSGNPCLWVEFGAFGGRWLPIVDVGEIGVGPQRIFAQGGYSYSGDGIGWGASTVEVLDGSLMDRYKRTWAWDNESDTIWFRHDPDITLLAGIDRQAGLTVINVDTYAMATVPGVYADAVPLADGRLATVTRQGVLAFIPDPVAGP